jgi:Calcineurin-like phosphoesterase
MKILVIPDVQAKPGHDFTYLNKLGKYIVEKKPDKIICLGDFADMPSLSSYDVGKKSFEGRRYTLDVKASHKAMAVLLAPLWEFNHKAIISKHKRYQPKMIMLYGNHENRINRAVNDDPKLDGVLSVEDLQYEDFGWKTVPFLNVHIEDGIAFSHYFTTGLAGRPASTASAQLSKKHMSCVAGHQQGLQIATAFRADGAQLTSIIAGSFYEHNEDYMSAQGNKHWRGVLMLHEVYEGSFDLMPISLNYINNKYA